MLLLSLELKLSHSVKNKRLFKFINNMFLGYLGIVYLLFDCRQQFSPIQLIILILIKVKNVFKYLLLSCVLADTHTHAYFFCCITSEVQSRIYFNYIF